MDVSDNEVFSVYPGRFNNPGDLIKGRTFRRLNVTRKILIKDIPSLITTALDMQTFCLGHRCVTQLRRSPMGSPLSPALCLMVVSISEQIWATNFKSVLENHHLFVRHIRYVDNRLILGDSRLRDLPPYEVLLDEGFYGKPIVLETEPDQEFLGFMLETMQSFRTHLFWSYQLFRKSCPPSLRHRQKCFSAGSDPDAASSPREPSRFIVFMKGSARTINSTLLPRRLRSG